MRYLALGFCILMLASCGEDDTGWKAEHSYGVSVEQTGSFNFPNKDGVHYVTKNIETLKGREGIRMRYRIDGGEVIGANCPPGPSAVTVYIQQKGDNMSGEGRYETYRWWATFASAPTTEGEHEIVASFSGRWTAVMSSNSIDKPAEFKAAIDNADKVGYTFANCTGYGHGAYSTGPARFTLLEYEVM